VAGGSSTSSSFSQFDAVRKAGTREGDRLFSCVFGSVEEIELFSAFSVMMEPGIPGHSNTHHQGEKDDCVKADDEHKYLPFLLQLRSLTAFTPILSPCGRRNKPGRVSLAAALRARD